MSLFSLESLSLVYLSTLDSFVSLFSLESFEFLVDLVLFLVVFFLSLASDAVFVLFFVFFSLFSVYLSSESDYLSSAYCCFFFKSFCAFFDSSNSSLALLFSSTLLENLDPILVNTFFFLSMLAVSFLILESIYFFDFLMIFAFSSANLVLSFLSYSCALFLSSFCKSLSL